MRRVRFGSTGLQVSALNFGTMTLGHPVGPEDSASLMDQAFEGGINFFDTANMYNSGISEEILGRWVTSRGIRDQVILSSKVRYPVGKKAHTAGLSASVIHREVEASLKRIQTDALDILFLHQPDDDTPIDVSLRAVDDLIRAGKVRTMGLSNYAAWQAADAVHRANQKGLEPPRVLQPMLNLVARGIEMELLPMARAFDMATCIYNPLAGGLLTEKQLQGEEAAQGSRLDVNPLYRQRYWQSELRRAAKELWGLAKEGGRTLPELSLRFALDHEGATTVLIGATQKQQLQELLRAEQAPSLSPEERERCDAVWQSLAGALPRYCRDNEDAKMH